MTMARAKPNQINFSSNGVGMIIIHEKLKVFPLQWGNTPTLIFVLPNSRGFD